MTEESPGSDPFVVALPVWVIVDAAMFATQGFPHGIVALSSDEGGKFIAIFTDQELAKSYIAQVPVRGAVPLKLATAHAIRGALAHYEKREGTTVGIDLTASGPQRGRFYPLSEMLQTLKDDPA